ncbi:isoquinoline 1-oxidoreductase subunit beta [Defluviimonas sp. 20V17]|uniref:Aldehyde dehydrogenase n=1 Tax=Allgaiera indica TaxID=765699 RepID=A0AAN5A1I4_9RHOB|nr:molybdopterin cofactor-binding domain-containing protein [Allgaiera indica]KDB04937.1 isoquinoline 1-oxidoreductase subunit beta [Defluviimonas sp. 20V17]GHE05700.1 aldehyde dehydrogenase [Allgaiera indica]SDX76417.1 isoquinoline 1-oxidoreductase, beta subunit [Allgaiera indica]
MARSAKIARRSFLIGSALVAGGLAFGYWRFVTPGPNPLRVGLGPDQATLNPYVILAPGGVTVIAPRAAMGQGAQSALAMLLAEEMDLDWETLRVIHGPPSDVYYNGAATAEALPFAPTDHSLLARGAREAGQVAAKFLGLQLTGGSSSIPDGFDKMRRAGAAARAVLLQAAARRTGLQPEVLKTAGSAVILPDGTRLRYVDLIPEARSIAPPQDPPLKPREAWRLIGRRVLRKGIEARSTGTERYGIDMVLPGMVFATVRRNPHLGAGVRRLDMSKAAAARGVHKVMPVRGGYAVVADNTWRAFQAADLVQVDWAPATYPADSAAMFAEVAGSFTEARRDSRLKDEGDVEAALSAPGAEVIEAEYRAPYLAHAPLEPMNATAWLRDGALTIWAGCQVPLYAASAAARAAGIPADRVSLHVLPMGGSFGRRLEDDFIAQAAEVAAAMPGVPVKMTWSREEDMTHDFCRPLAMARGRGRVGRGRIEALDLAIAAPSTTASQMGRLGLPSMGPDTAIVAGAWDQPLAIEALRITGYRVPEMAPVSSWRSVGASVNGFFHEGFIDELLQAAGADPLQARLRMITDAPSRKVLEAVGEMSSWGAPLPAGWGRGLAFTLSFGVPVAEVVDVEQTDQGLSIRRAFVAADLGVVVDPVTTQSQMQGGLIWGLGHAMGAEITFARGAIEQRNFDSYPFLRISQCPEIHTRALEVGDRVHGIGEPCVPPAAPALAAAIFRATGKRLREMPFSRQVDFA